MPLLGEWPWADTLPSRSSAPLSLKWGTSPASQGFSGDSGDKESACKAGDAGSIPVLERSPGGGHGNSLEYSCRENPMNRGAWRVAVHGVTKSRAGLKPQTTHTHARLSRLCPPPPALARLRTQGSTAASAEPQTLRFQEPSLVRAPGSPDPTRWPGRHNSGRGRGGEL